MEHTHEPNKYEPFTLEGDSTGCLLVHGFGGSPAEMRPLGDYLHAQGYTVRGVQLPGHTGSLEALQGVTWRDWYAALEADFTLMRARCARLVLVGFSLGGALALLLAHRRLCDSVVALATPLKLAGDWRLGFLPVARYVTPWYYPLRDADFNDPLIREQMLMREPSLDLDDPAVQQHLRELVRMPVGAIDELQQVLQRARRALPRVTVPVAAHYGLDDRQIPLDSAYILMQHLGSPQRSLRWWADTAHQLVEVGPHREAIFAQVAAFVAATSGAPTTAT